MIITAEQFHKVVIDWRARGALDRAGQMVVEEVARRYEALELAAEDAIRLLTMPDVKSEHPAMAAAIGQLRGALE